MSTLCPQPILNFLEKDFRFPDALLIGQLATIGDKGPWQRSIRIYALEENQGLILLTHNQSRKWSQLSSDPLCSICLLEPSYRIQLTARCKASLLTKKGNEKLFQKYWSLVRKDVKKFYLENPSLPTPEEPTPLFGMVALRPVYWESLELEEDYLLSKRCKYEVSKEGIWTQTQIPL